MRATHHSIHPTSPLPPAYKSTLRSQRAQQTLVLGAASAVNSQSLEMADMIHESRWPSSLSHVTCSGSVSRCRIAQLSGRVSLCSIMFLHRRKIISKSIPAINEAYISLAFGIRVKGTLPQEGIVSACLICQCMNIATKLNEKNPVIREHIEQLHVHLSPFINILCCSSRLMIRLRCFECYHVAAGTWNRRLVL